MPGKNEYPYAMKTKITIVVRNQAGIEEKRVHEAYFALDMASVERPWFVLRNFLAPRYATKNYGAEGQGWVRVEEAKIIEVINRENPSEFYKIPLRVMTYNQLSALSDLKELGVDPYQFPTVEFARQMLQLRIDDPTGYEVQLAEFKARHAEQDPQFDSYRRGDAPLDEITPEEFQSTRAVNEEALETTKAKIGAPTTAQHRKPLKSNPNVKKDQKKDKATTTTDGEDTHEIDPFVAPDVLSGM